MGFVKLFTSQYFQPLSVVGRKVILKKHWKVKDVEQYKKDTVMRKGVKGVLAQSFFFFLRLVAPVHGGLWIFVCERLS